ARPSDAIALALRMRAPIFVDEEVMRKAAIQETAEEEEDKQKKELSRLEKLNLELERAVQEERFEDAARIRDEIRELEKEAGEK
ncbi:hypothetical protein DRP98_09075, partial [candidate division KSB1 bacterium]